MGVIHLEKMEFYGFHGHFAEEQKIGNQFMVDLVFETDMKKASATDKLEDAADYQIAYKIVQTEMAIPSSLLEHVSSRILKKLLSEMSSVEKATIKVSKLNPPMGGRIGAVSVERSMYRKDLK